MHTQLTRISFFFFLTNTHLKVYLVPKSENLRFVMKKNTSTEVYIVIFKNFMCKNNGQIKLHFRKIYYYYTIVKTSD